MEYELSSKHKDKFVVTVAITLLIFLAINIAFTMYYMVDYENRKDSGNERWKQVEERIITIENKVENVEKELNILKEDLDGRNG